MAIRFSYSGLSGPLTQGRQVFFNIAVKLSYRGQSCYRTQGSKVLSSRAVRFFTGSSAALSKPWRLKLGKKDKDKETTSTCRASTGVGSYLKSTTKLT